MKIKKLILILVCLVFAIGVGYYFLFFNQDKSGNSVADNVFGWKFPVEKFPITGSNGNIAYSSIRDAGGIPKGLPVRLKIPVIGVDSAIEDALVTPDGRMDVPAGSLNVAWFSLGPNPGETGSAVIGGHFGIKDGVKFVFYDLDKLKVNDKIYIENDKGDTLAFQVRRIELFNRNADATTVFTSEDGFSHLNLITCEGIWNKINNNYPERRVVFSDSIPSEGVVSIKIPIFYQTLRFGSHGSNVIALQTALNQNGISPGIIDGSFGKITRFAVMKYQTNNHLFSDGVFGPLTRAKLIPEVAVKPTFPVTALVETKINSSKIITQDIKSLYENPIDGLVTSIIIIGILFMLFKIIKR